MRHATSWAPLLPLLAACAWAPLAGCARPSRDAPAAPAPSPPPPPQVRADRTDLVFSYIDPLTGSYASTSSVGGVPEAARAHVVVTDLSQTPEQRQAARYVVLTDLRAPSGDGTYPVSIASRHALAAAAGAQAQSTSGVVVYTTSWCGVCQRTKALLRELGVPFTERDVEASRSAAEELATKAKQAGLSTGGVPVIDVAGTLMQGLDEGTLRRTLTEKGFLKARGT